MYVYTGKLQANSAGASEGTSMGTREGTRERTSARPRLRQRPALALVPSAQHTRLHSCQLVVHAAPLQLLHAAPQVDIESKVWSAPSFFSFNRWNQAQKEEADEEEEAGEEGWEEEEEEVEEEEEEEYEEEIDAGTAWGQRAPPYLELVFHLGGLSEHAHGQGLIDIACHVIGCHLTQDTRVRDALDDVARWWLPRRRVPFESRYEDSRCA
jgi:hypothetical protein